ncbi:uncharacterized protein At4g17910 isoform X3 [Tripterygium wilfordii]|uniref:uncharacterized protein At4g17910 isoform X3 n=1 Tax=Tripterygium wilfordii TaxID=458696 RepID=UPI0018F7E756|nr:uncharacterized protein At4g17910 isoform X3 [Tripterygium wilfordii]
MESLNPNKLLKEEFVSNLNGSSMLEIAVLSTIVPGLMLLRHAISSYGITDIKSKISSKKDDDVLVPSKNWLFYLATVTVDFIFIVLPMILFFSVLARWIYIFTIFLMILIFSTAAKRRYFSSHKEVGSIPLRENVSAYRVSMVIVTCLCILAVDFRIFPRRYAKTETYGTSLMDLGVGSFVVANSLVSRQARNLLSRNWKNAVQSTSPLLLLGFGRLLSTASVDYQVHVGEYGVHWNFFFTLAAVSILTSIINVRPRYSGIFGLVILIGYWGMYLLGVQLGYYLFFGSNNHQTNLRSNNWARIRVWCLSLLFWLLTLLLDRHVERVSRRTCNLAYVTFVLAQNLQVLAVLMLSDYVPGSKISTLEEAFNRNLLGSFLLANVLTGLVNLCVDTLFVPSLTSLFILLVYAYALSIITGIADFCGIRLKFW